MEEPQKRQIAYKVRIKEIIDSTYAVEEGLQPNTMITSSGKRIARVNLVGIIVLKSERTDSNYQSMLLDDGTGKISVRSFEDKNPLSRLSIGDAVMLVGKPRQYGQEKYIVPEIIKKIENRDWIELRKIELGEKNHNHDIESTADNKEALNEEVSTEEEVLIEVKPMNNPEKIFALIRELDNGPGADTQELIDKCGIDDIEKIIKNLLEHGEIFEIKPGKLKILE